MRPAIKVGVGAGLALAGLWFVSASLSLGQVERFVEWARWDRYGRICFEDLIVVIEEWKVGPIPVGCEVIDCCPGCPGPGFIDWRIRFEGDPAESLVLQFENLSEEAARKVVIEGNARWAEGNRLVVGKGETILKGFPGDMDRPPVALPQLSPNVDLIRQRGAARQQDGPEQAGGGIAQADSIVLVIDQLLGPVVVNEYRLQYVALLCPPFLLEDEIDLNNNTNNDQAVVCVDGRRSSGCVDDETRRGNDRIGVGNLLSRGTCPSEVVVFSDDNAVALIENVNVWTNSSGDKLNVNLAALLQAPVSVWVARAGGTAAANADIANANLLYNTNHLGIAFNAAVQNVATDTAALTAIGTGCANAVTVQGSPYFTANRLNVYYVNSAFTGVNCGANRNIQYVGTTANNQTLAHEFGHSFTLGHTNGLAGFPATNVMIGGGAGRTHFSEGQAFRVNVNTNSTLNTNGVRAGPTRNCPDGTTSAACPALSRDATPN